MPRLGDGSQKAVMKRFIWLFLFALSFAYVESAIVVYLREIFYPSGFGFPLNLMVCKIGFIELGREVFTLIMLAAVGIAAGRTRWERLSFFLFLFAISGTQRSDLPVQRNLFRQAFHPVLIRNFYFFPHFHHSGAPEHQGL